MVVRQQVYLALLEKMHAMASQIGDCTDEVRRQLPLHREAPLLDIGVLAIPLFGTGLIGCAGGAECFGSRGGQNRVRLDRACCRRAIGELELVLLAEYEGTSFPAGRF